MRISGWLVAALGLVALVIFTGLFSFVAYGTVRQVVIDLWESGVVVESPGQLAAALSGDLEPQPTPGSTLPEAQPIVVLAPPTPTPAPDQPQAPTGPEDTAPAEEETAQQDPLTASITPITDPRQIRILLMGIDQRRATGETGPFRTDTMMVLNVDPVRKTAGVISLPRDLWVTIPNFGHDRINNANFIGEVNAYPGGGPALAMETVAANFGISVDRYLLINFDVFVTAVDTLAPNGVEVCIERPIYDPTYPDAAYGTMEVRFDPGCQRLDGERLLQFARTRATEGGDFDRARRQQVTLDAMRAEFVNAGGVMNFINQAPLLWEQLADSFRTNLSLEEILRLGLLMNEIESDNIRYAVVDNLYVDLATTPSGDRVLIPRQTYVSDLIQRVFYPRSDLDLAALRTRSTPENASVVVFNNTQISGLASSTREWLVSRGVVVSGIDSVAGPTSENTWIQDYTGNPWTARYLAALLGLSEDRIRPGVDGLTTADVLVLVGPDIQALLAGETAQP